MDPRRVTSFARWFKFPSFRKQILLLLPTVLVVIVFLVVGVYFFYHMQYKTADALVTQGVGAEVSKEIIQQTNPYYKLIWVVTGVVGLGAVLWIWGLSVWVFGPFARVEKELNDVLYGKMDPSKLKVRKGDALFPLIELMRKALSKSKDQPPPDPK